MKVIEHINKAKSDNPIFSYEIIPPARGGTLKKIIDIVEQLAPYDPPFIDVTSHAATAYYHEYPDGTIEKKVLRKHPGTIGICGVIQNRFNIDTVAHILCNGFTQSETEDALIELSYLGIQNILALRGDETNHKKAVAEGKPINHFSVDLVKQVKDLNQGKFLHDFDANNPMDFCIGVAGYPEKHFEAPNLKIDLKHLKEKVDAGAEYICTQMFYNNKAYFDYVSECKAMGITIPIIPGIKVLTSVKQLNTIPKKFFINFPDDLVDEVMSNEEHVKEIGFRWALKQTEELLSKGIPCVHFYIMNDPSPVIEIIKKLKI